MSATWVAGVFYVGGKIHKSAWWSWWRFRVVFFSHVFLPTLQRHWLFAVFVDRFETLLALLLWGANWWAISSRCFEWERWQERCSGCQFFKITADILILSDFSDGSAGECLCWYWGIRTSRCPQRCCDRSWSNDWRRRRSTVRKDEWTPNRHGWNSLDDGIGDFYGFLTSFPVDKKWETWATWFFLACATRCASSARRQWRSGKGYAACQTWIQVKHMHDWHKCKEISGHKTVQSICEVTILTHIRTNTMISLCS